MADKADDTYLLLFWSALALVFSVYVLWKYLKSTYSSKPQEIKLKTAEDVNTARLKHFLKTEDLASLHTKASSSSSPLTQETPLSQQKDGSARQFLGAARKPGDKVQRVGESQASDTLGRFISRRVIPGPGSAGSSPDGATSDYFDPGTGSPISRPLASLQGTLNWRPGNDAFNDCSVPLKRETSAGVEERPRTLVCHDMKGGYIEDRFTQGFSSRDCYYIYHWHLIDIFVYFSHNFVTIPPPCWTNAAHTHGVHVLGTLITEWEDGAQICSEFLEDQRSLENLANQLVDIAEYYRFDGWLINIENPIQPVQVNNLADFVQYLTIEMHRRLPHSLVIWYDSVTFTGDLKWQNELNVKNRLFFDACDGIFLNYIWSESHLMRSASMAGRSRRSDVYVGVDVFGRGCYGGGGYSCNKAMKLIHDEKLSTAIFAPGWVMEKFGSENFPANQNKFWNLLSPYCHVHTPVKSLPFVTSFCRGNGDKVFIDGKVVYSEPWTNLSAQQVQKTYINTFFNLGAKTDLEISSVEHSLGDAFNGGGCLLVEGQARASENTSKGVVRLFKTELVICSPLLIAYTFKLTSPNDCIEVALQLHTDRKPTYLLLCPETSDGKAELELEEDSILNRRTKQRYGISASRMVTSSPFSSPIGQEHFQAYAPLNSADCDHIQRICGADESCDAGELGWKTRCYLVTGKHLIDSTIQEVRLVCVNPLGAANETDIQGDSFKLRLGEIKILDPQVLSQSIPFVTNLRCMDVKWTSADHKHSLTLTLAWDSPGREELVDRIDHYDVYYLHNQRPSFIGRAFVECYRVCQLTILEGCTHVEFVVRPTTLSGLKSPLKDCSRVKLTWT